jgi:hypothetical protein
MMKISLYEVVFLPFHSLTFLKFLFQNLLGHWQFCLNWTLPNKNEHFLMNRYQSHSPRNSDFLLILKPVLRCRGTLLRNKKWDSVPKPGLQKWTLKNLQFSWIFFKYMSIHIYSSNFRPYYACRYTCPNILY